MSEEQISAHLVSAAVICVLMISTWLVSLVCKDASIIDMCWGAGFVAVVWALFLNVDERQWMHWLLLTLTSVWGLRLTIHLTVRNLGKPEDFRYQAMREKRGKSFPLASLFIVFGLQGVIMWIVSLPIQVGMAVTAPGPMLFAVIGVLLWGTGLFFETVGDWQLVQFKRNPDNVGRVLDTGLWKYTRHPNYFGDFLVWWGLFLVAVSQCSAWWTIVCPATMAFFLVRISGVSLLEKTLHNTKPVYADYVSRTNAFLPGRPGRRP
jgi:steroid 5-alpha reductase family enzyme